MGGKIKREKEGGRKGGTNGGGRKVEGEEREWRREDGRVGG